MEIAMIRALSTLADQDARLLYLLSDSGCEYDALFARNYPSQYLDLGIAEQHLVSFAAGAAACGRIPFIYTAAPFLAYRAFESIRDDVCMPRRNVKLVAQGSGLSNSALGPTHHGTEDIALMRVLPGMTLLSPTTTGQVEEMVRAAFEVDGPVYIRTGFQAPYTLPEDAPPFEVGKLQPLRDGTDACLYATGTITGEAMAAAELLAAEGISLRVVNVTTLKPFDTQGVLEDAARFPMLFTLEEHNIAGGLGSLVCESLASAGVSARVGRMGVENRFAKGYGTHADMLAQNGLDAPSILRFVRTEMGVSV